MALDLEKLSKEQKDNAFLIGSKAEKAGIDPDLALALAWQENRFNSKGLSPKGAVGIMQIMPATAKSYGYTKEDLDDKYHNIDLGLTILKDHLTKYDNNPRASLVAYNAGPKVADRYLKNKEVPTSLPEETKNYLESIDTIYSLAGGTPDTTEEATSFFDPTEPLPPHLKEDPKYKSEDVVERNLRVAKEAIQENPTTTGGLLGGAEGYLQYKLNKEFADQAKANAIKEATSMPTESSGDKWSRKVVGSQGPGGASVTEAASNYQTAKNLPPNLGLTREGIALDTLTKDRLAAEDRAMAKQLEAERIAKSKQFVPRAKKAAQYVANQAKGLIKLPVVNVLGGLGAGYNVNQAIERGKEGDYIGAGIKGVEAGLNAMASIPATANPYLLGAKGIGTLGSLGMIPIDMSYSKYKELKSKKPVVEVGEPEIIQQP